jgi:hypothetical protein
VDNSGSPQVEGQNQHNYLKNKHFLDAQIPSRTLKGLEKRAGHPLIHRQIHSLKTDAVEKNFAPASVWKAFNLELRFVSHAIRNQLSL